MARGSGTSSLARAARPKPNDRCDCSSCGGSKDGCPHEGCWQCDGINAPQCNAGDDLKRCEVEVHGTHGAEKYYITEVCPGAPVQSVQRAQVAAMRRMGAAGH